MPTPTEPDAGEPDGLPPGRPRRRRAQTARLSPQALAAARGGVREGLDWLGREPEASASLLYRLARLLARAILFGAFRFRVATSGQEHLPAGGYILVGAVHRGWMDPFLIHARAPARAAGLVPRQRPVGVHEPLAGGLLHRLGGMLPVWRGGVGIEQHVASARAVLAATAASSS